MKALWSAIAGTDADPYLKGRAMQLGGAALIADGLFGLENPLDGRRTRAGIAGSFLLMLFGGAFVALALLISSGSRPHTDGVTVDATVVAVARNGSSSSTCSPTVEYQVAGETYTVSSGISSSGWCGLGPGSTLQVSYLPDAPQEGRVLLDDSMMRLFLPIPVLVIFVGFVTFVVRAAELAGGGWLVWRGRKLAKGQPERSIEEVFAQLQAAWNSVPHRHRTDPSSSTGNIGGLVASLAGGALPAAVAAPPIQPTPQMPPPGTSPQPTPMTTPPPGWYPDPWQQAPNRWWDGIGWSDRTS